MKHAVIEITVSGAELLIAETDGKGAVKPVLKNRAAFPLHWHIKNKRMQKGAVGEIAAAANEYKSACLAAGVEKPEAVFLSFMECVENAAEIVAEIERATDLKFKVLSKEETVRCLLYAACGQAGADGLIVIDSGGGALRMADAGGGSGVSLPGLGSVKLSAECIRNILPKRDEVRAVKKQIKKKASDFLGRGFSRAVFAGNAAVSVAKIYADFYGEGKDPEGVTLKYKKLQKLFATLVETPRQATLITRHAPERINTVLTSMAVFLEILKLLKIAEAAVKNYGLPEGYLYGLANGLLAPEERAAGGGKAKREKK